jgi:hypothetical protein
VDAMARASDRAARASDRCARSAFEVFDRRRCLGS